MAANIKALRRCDKALERTEWHFEIWRFLLPRDHVRANLCCLFLGRVTIDRILRLFPGMPAAWNIADIGKSLCFQNAGGNAGAITAGTVDRCRLRLIQFAKPLPQFREKN